MHCAQKVQTSSKKNNPKCICLEFCFKMQHWGLASVICWFPRMFYGLKNDSYHNPLVVLNHPMKVCQSLLELPNIKHHSCLIPIKFTKISISGKFFKAVCQNEATICMWYLYFSLPLNFWIGHSDKAASKR